MNTRNYQILHLNMNENKRTSIFIAVLHFTLAIASSKMSISSYPKMNMKRPVGCRWVVIFTSVDKHYICTSLWCHFVYIISCSIYMVLIIGKPNTGEDSIFQMNICNWRNEESSVNVPSILNGDIEHRLQTCLIVA